MPDKSGKPWASVADTKKGSVLIPYGGFTCLKNKAAVTVEEDYNGGGLFVCCSQGRHWLDANMPDGTEYVGFYPAGEN